MNTDIMRMKLGLPLDKQVALAYTRVSHRKQLESGLSLIRQDEKSEEYWERKLKDTHFWGGAINDGTNISAFSNPFFKRPAGKIIKSVMRPGDVLIVDKVDRMFRSTRDFSRVIEWFDDKGCHLHFIDMFGGEVNQATPIGAFILHVLVGVAELESKMISSRTKAGLEVAHMKRYGQKTIPKARMGYIYDNSQKMYVPDLERREEIRVVHSLYLSGASFREIQSKMEDRWIKTNQGKDWFSQPDRFTPGSVKYAISLHEIVSELGGWPAHPDTLPTPTQVAKMWKDGSLRKPTPAPRKDRLELQNEPLWRIDWNAEDS